jgi:hypothetical protein
MNERVFEIAMNDVVTGFIPSHVLTPVATWITYAVEIDGDAPLYFSIEAVDE